MNVIFNIGNQPMQMNLIEMQVAFASIAGSQKSDLFAIQSGLTVIQELGDFLTKASENLAIGYVDQQSDVNIKIKHLKQCFGHAMLIRSNGTIDLLAKNIFKPEEKLDITTITLKLRLNSLGKEVLANLEKELIIPVSEALDNIEMEILAKTMQGVEVIDEEEQKLYAATETGNHPTQIELSNREGSYVPDFGTNYNLKNALIKEAKTMKKPKDL
jgi:hypothetical protein